MRRQYSRTSLIFSIIGIWLLLAPMLVELYHSVDELHKTHDVCTEQTTHIHQTPLDCSICDFHVSFYTFKFLEPNFKVATTYRYRNSLQTTSLESQNTSYHFLLRGPPLIS